MIAKPLALPLILLAGLAACERATGPLLPAATPAPQTAAAPPLAEEVAQAAAAELAAQAGQDGVGGVRVLGARAEGPAVIADFQLPVAGAALTEAQRAELAPAFTSSLRNGFCDDAAGQRFFELGNVLQVRFQGSDGVQLADLALTSCG